MQAAADSQKLLSLENQILNGTWKDKLDLYQSLIAQFEIENVEINIELLYLEMLNEKNLNVLKKVFKLIQTSSKIKGLCRKNQKQLGEKILQFGIMLPVEVKETLVELYLACKTNNHRNDILESLGVHLETAKDKNILLVLEIYQELVQKCKIRELLNLKRLIMSLESLSANMLFNETIDLALLSFLQVLLTKVGYNAVILAKSINFSLIGKLLEVYDNTQLDSVEHLDLVYHCLPGSREWFAQYKDLPAKTINQSLQQIENVEVDLNTRFLTSLIQLSKRKNNTTNKYIYSILKSNHWKLRESQATILCKYFDLVFELISNKRVIKDLQQNNFLQFCLKAPLLSKKIQKSSTQEQYHRIIILFEFMQGKLSLVEKIQLYNELCLQPNLNHVHRVKIDHLIKEMVTSNLHPHDSPEL